MIDSTIAPIARRTGPSKQEKDNSKICKFIKIGSVITAIAIPILASSIAYIIAFTAIKVTLINPKFTLALKIVAPLVFGAGISLIEISLYICISCKNHQKINSLSLIIEHETLEEDENKGLVEKEEEVLVKEEDEALVPIIHEEPKEEKKALVPKYSEADNKIIEQYGKELVETLGINLVRGIPEVDPGKLGLQFDFNFSELNKPFHPNLLEENVSKVRGTFLSLYKQKMEETDFIATKIDILDEYHQYIDTYVSTIMFTHNEDILNFTIRTCISKKNKPCKEVFTKYLFRVRPELDFLNLKKLIDGEEIEVSRSAYKIAKLINLTITEENLYKEIKLFLRVAEKEIIIEEYMERFEEIQKYSTLIPIETVDNTDKKTIYCFSSIFIN